MSNTRIAILAAAVLGTFLVWFFNRKTSSVDMKPADSGVRYITVVTPPEDTYGHQILNNGFHYQGIRGVNKINIFCLQADVDRMIALAGELGLEVMPNLSKTEPYTEVVKTDFLGVPVIKALLDDFVANTETQQ